MFYTFLESLEILNNNVLCKLGFADNIKIVLSNRMFDKMLFESIKENKTILKTTKLKTKLRIDIIAYNNFIIERKI